jgi:hypothetical protein
MGSKVNKTGRSKGNGRFLALPHHILHSTAYLGLSCVARAVLIEIAAIYNGSNNGRLAAGVRWLAERCRIGRDSASRAIQELEDAGFIETVEKGSFNLHQRKASEYRITWVKCDASQRFSIFQSKQS